MDEDEILWTKCTESSVSILRFAVTEVREDAPSDDRRHVRERSGKPFTATRIGTASTID